MPPSTVCPGNAWTQSGGRLVPLDGNRRRTTQRRRGTDKHQQITVVSSPSSRGDVRGVFLSYGVQAAYTLWLHGVPHAARRYGCDRNAGYRVPRTRVPCERTSRARECCPSILACRRVDPGHCRRADRAVGVLRAAMNARGDRPLSRPRDRRVLGTRRRVRRRRWQTGERCPESHDARAGASGITLVSGLAVAVHQ
jgi:hypothetical protein